MELLLSMSSQTAKGEVAAAAERVLSNQKSRKQSVPISRHRMSKQPMLQRRQPSIEKFLEWVII
jgi:hypothetical protein